MRDLLERYAQGRGIALRRATDLCTDGVRVGRFLGSRFIPYRDVEAVEQQAGNVTLKLGHEFVHGVAMR